ncbi:MAG: 3-oxoacyl-[acyl-carrier-protein] synthase III [Candidatus Magnetoglobus multicellularis str. Araruama]|uniref:3-oxoacyl-[acyl-carrier-protein] synthase III n=1 Tax=Candidatus Magnetoglobus multicellularis str. Araruama TaxID=890399 RepID=A0A1V1PGX1_9BACT|nr:MAG: 3-oxoacyl-[acyl-carrier-protein] synthase III [Candidatus Magnetoglobus multicellularis str. Araruama]
MFPKLKWGTYFPRIPYEQVTIVSKSIFTNIKIKGIAGVVPKDKVVNLEAHAHLTEVEKKKAIKLTGVHEYRKASPEVCASDLCQHASEILFEHLNISPSTIDAILFVSQTPDYRLPSTSCLLQHKLSCHSNTLAFDMNLGCSGFIYGLYTACSFLQGAGLNRILLLCGDTQTKLCHSEDKNVSFILGDAGTATIIDIEKNASDIKMELMTDGSRYNKLMVPAGGFRTPSTVHTRMIKKQSDGGIRSQEHISMDGMEIFNFSVTDVVKSIRNFMNDENIDEHKTDYLILHQANKFMTDKIARKLKFSSGKVPYSLNVFGNTSCASIPITIAHHFSQHKISGKKTVFFQDSEWDCPGESSILYWIILFVHQ